MHAHSRTPQSLPACTHTPLPWHAAQKSNPTRRRRLILHPLTALPRDRPLPTHSVRPHACAVVAWCVLRMPLTPTSKSHCPNSTIAEAQPAFEFPINRAKKKRIPHSLAHAPHWRSITRANHTVLTSRVNWTSWTQQSPMVHPACWLLYPAACLPPSPTHPP